MHRDFIAMSGVRALDLGVRRKAMAKASIEDQLAILRQLRASAGSDEPAEIADKLRPFLRQANNLLVGRAADLARELDARVLLPDLVSAFERFLDAPAKSDPQCWAKNALSKALHHLGCDRSALFLEGMRLHQYEPVWGGQSDVAGTLRANCAHALIDCHELTHQDQLLHLLSLAADIDKAVRAEVMRAITAAGGDSAILLLRLRALTAGPEEDPSVIGQCYAGVLSLEGTAAVPFVAQFLSNQDDCSAEAAVALGETRTPEALAALLACLRPAEPSEPLPRVRMRRPDTLLDPVFASVFLSSIALTRQPLAIETLLDLVASESSYAEAAIEALANAGFGEDVRQRLAIIVQKLDNARITRTHQRHFPA
jgi:hypothetical protein